MKILITGGSGFIGSAFIRLALSRGHEIAALLTPRKGVPANVPENPNLIWLRGRLEAVPWAEIAAFGADVCLHAAWITTPGACLESIENKSLLDASLRFLRKTCEFGVSHIVGLGTCSEYQIQAGPLSEDQTPSIPNTLYGHCKNQLRLALEADAQTGHMLFGWGRVFYTFGPGEHRLRLCSSIVHKLSRNEAVVLRTPDSIKDYIYVEDVASAVMAVIESRFRGVINLGTGTGTPVREIAAQLGQIMKKKHLIEEAQQAESDPCPRVIADATKLRALGWKPQWTLQAGLEEIVRAYHNRASM